MGQQEDFQSAVQRCVEDFDADLILINGQMANGIDRALREGIRSLKVLRPNAVLILVTEGGQADAAYKGAKVLQTRYERLTVCIPGWCKSAGTLFAIAGHELIIGDEGELGPLDVQLAVRDELGDRNSGLIMESAIESMRTESFRLFETFMMGIKARSGNLVTFRTAADLAAQLTVGLMTPVFEQIDPLRLGDYERAQKIGMDYGVRLNRIPQNLQDNDSLVMLVRGYPSHSFVINRTEASELFNNVKALDGSLADLVKLLGPLALEPSDDPQIGFLSGDESGDEDEQEASDGPPDVIGKDIPGGEAGEDHPPNDNQGKEPPQQLRSDFRTRIGRKTAGHSV